MSEGVLLSCQYSQEKYKCPAQYSHLQETRVGVASASSYGFRSMDLTVPHIVGVYLISHGLTHPDFQLSFCQLSSTLTAMSTATWRQFFTYHPLHLPDLLWRPDCEKKNITGTTNTPKSLLAQFGSRSRRTNACSLKSEGSLL